MNESIGSHSEEILFDQKNDIIYTKINDEQCIFCSDIDMLRCMWVSVMKKHNEDDNFQVKLMNKILDEDSENSVRKKFISLMDSIDEERLARCYEKCQSMMQMGNLLEFYKFRRFVPRFVPNIQSSMVQNYYYQRLKLYYNQIKRKLNITVDPSSQFTEFTGGSSSLSMELTKNLVQKVNVLEQLHATIKLEETTGPTLQNYQNYQTESKALQNLVCFLKSYPKIESVSPFSFQPLSKSKKSSKQIFKDFLQKNKKKNTITNENKNKIFITFFSKSNSKPKTIHQNLSKPLKIKNASKIKVKLKQPNNNAEISTKLEKIKQEILNQKVKDIIKTKVQQQKRFTSTKAKTASHGQACQSSNKKLMISNGNQNKILHDKDQLKQLSKLKPKRVSSESKIKSTKVESMKNFLNGQKILLKNQSSGKKEVDILENQRPLSRRKSLDLAKLKKFLKENENKKVQHIEKNEDYLSQKYENLVFETPKRLIRTTNVTPIISRRQKDEVNQIVFQKSDNIVSMKKKKLQLLKRNMQIEKSQRK